MAGEGRNSVMITIRELADSCNISVRTLQYYDQIDLLKPSGYQGRIRLYDEAAKKKLKCILAWKVLGLSLEEITKLSPCLQYPLRHALFVTVNLTVLIADSPSILQHSRICNSTLPLRSSFSFHKAYHL